jgi:6-pyruvoyltetrahydropterin/6-carboxytetrahydropterin synthase
MLTITRRIEFDAGHRLTNHESKCRNVHGHRYAALITVRAPSLDEVGRVIDFGKVKEIVGGWVDEKWDHGFIAESKDPIISWLASNDMKVFIMGCPPTAENMSKQLFKKAELLLAPLGIEVTNVRLFETPNCYADYNPGAL